jgi:hypothetical protein
VIRRVTLGKGEVIRPPVPEINRNGDHVYRVYIGRGDDIAQPPSPLKNTFRIEDFGGRKPVLVEYERYLRGIIQESRGPVYSALARIGAMDLLGEVCLCCACGNKPDGYEGHYCHGDVIKQIIEELNLFD